MKKTIKALQRGIKAAMAAPEPQRFQAGGKIIACSQCGSTDFVPYELTKSATEGLLRELYGLRCAKCSHLEFFAQRPLAIEDSTP
jgi:hypothetical protein